MDYRFSFQRPMRRNSFCSMKGTIVDLVPAGQGGRRADGCLLFAAIEDTDGNTVNFFINPDTYVVDFTTLSVGMMATFWYRNDAPMPLIYPPQYTAVVVAEERSDRNVDMSYYSNSLVNEEQTSIPLPREAFLPRPRRLQWWYCVTETVVRQTKEDSCSP